MSLFNLTTNNPEMCCPYYINEETVASRVNDLAKDIQPVSVRIGKRSLNHQNRLASATTFVKKHPA